MMHYTTILTNIGPDRFAHVVAGSSRKAKETYFARHNIRHTPQVGKIKLGSGHKMQARVTALFDALQKTQDEPMAEEILRLYLLGKRSLLALALDHLKIPHEDGLTESDEVSRLAMLTPIERAELIALAVHQKVADQADVELYLDYMAANHAREQEAASQAG
jgi:hypothetical protein